MKSRRSVLRSTCALLGAGATVGLAGCTIEVGDPEAAPRDDDPTDDSEPERDDGEEPDDREGSNDGEGPDATEALTRHRETFGKILTDLRRATEDPDVSLDDHDIEQRLDETETALEETEEEIGSQEQGDQYRTLHELQRLLDTLVDVIQMIGDSMDQHSVAITDVGEVSYAQIETQLENAEENLREARRPLNRNHDRFDEIRSALDEFDEINTEDLEWVIDRVTDVSEVLFGVSDGLRPWTRAYDTFLTAATDYDDDHYRDARRGMRRAEDMFSEAVDVFEATKVDTPQDLQEFVDSYLCLAEAFEDAAGHYATAAAAALDGDEETVAVEEDRAETALERCD